jgi:uncharacterized protein YecT (DUF1311 family)
MTDWMSIRGAAAVLHASVFAAPLVSLFALFAADVARAQSAKPSAAEVKAVRECAAKYAEDLEAAERECLFKLVAAPCADRPDHQANAAQADCFRLEASIWDDLLNENYRELRDALGQDQQAKLREMQQAWVTSRDRTCGFYHHKIQGTMAVPMAAACLARETHRRAMLLKFFGGL